MRKRWLAVHHAHPCIGNFIGELHRRYISEKARTLDQHARRFWSYRFFGRLVRSSVWGRYGIYVCSFSGFMFLAMDNEEFREHIRLFLVNSGYSGDIGRRRGHRLPFFGVWTADRWCISALFSAHVICMFSAQTLWLHTGGGEGWGCDGFLGVIEVCGGGSVFCFLYEIWTAVQQA